MSDSSSPNSQAPGRRRRKLQSISVRQRRLLAGIIAGKSVHQAALDAGYNKSVAKGEIYARIRGPVFQAHIHDLMARHGMTDEQLFGKLAKLVEAKETKFFSHQGHVIDTRTVTSWEARAKGLEIALRVKDYFPRQGTDEDPSARTGPTSFRVFLEVPGGAPPSGTGGRFGFEVRQDA